MNKFYLAVTYEVCEHNDLYMDMNEYTIEQSDDLEERVKEIAKTDIAPIIKVYESDTRDFSGCKLYKEYSFQEYECNCDEELS